MGNSLQDQLLKANLANKKQAHKAKKQKHQARKKPGTNQREVVSAEQLQRQQAEKVERDRQLNLQKQEEAKRKSVAAQVRQLIEGGRLSRKEGETPYQFVDGSSVRKIYVTETMYGQLVSGQLCIARLEARYEVVPKGVAEKIAQRDATVLIQSDHQSDTAAETEDEYAGYEVPDDLMW